MLSHSEASPKERALALCWVFHIVGDIHQPMHVSDLFSESFPAGNGAGTMSYVWDPVTDSPIPLHILWDSNALRVPSLEAVDRAKESYQIAADWVYEDVQTAPDPDKHADTARQIQNMMNFILYGKAPVDDAPQLPDGYWLKLQPAAERRITLAGYRIADLILWADDQIEAQRKFITR